MAVKIACVIMNFICGIIWTAIAIKKKTLLGFIAASCFFLSSAV